MTLEQLLKVAAVRRPGVRVRTWARLLELLGVLPK